jgi:hypothetical protein
MATAFLGTLQVIVVEAEPVPPLPLSYEATTTWLPAAVAEATTVATPFALAVAVV